MTKRSLLLKLRKKNLLIFKKLKKMLIQDDKEIAALEAEIEEQLKILGV